MATYTHTRIHTNNGFTLIELLFTLSLILVMTTLAIPSYHDTFRKSRPKISLKKVKKAIVFSRHYAMTHDTFVSLCGLVQNRCHKDLWHETLTSFEDKNRNHILDDDERILSVTDSINLQDELSYPRHAITFEPNGSLRGLANGTFIYCTFDLEGTPSGLAMSVNHAGRARIKDARHLKKCKKRI